MSEMEHYQNKIIYAQSELERLERQKDQLKGSGQRVYTGNDEMSELNLMRKKAEELD